MRRKKRGRLTNLCGLQLLLKSARQPTGRFIAFYNASDLTQPLTGRTPDQTYYFEPLLLRTAA
jgi:hypothetical protein